MGGKRRLYVVLAAVLVAVGAASYALADQLDGPGKVPDSKEFKATLNGFQETPSVSTTGFGEFRATLDEHGAVPTIHFVFRYGGLEGGHSLFAHVHFGERGVAGGVSYFLCGGSTKPNPCPDVDGVIEGDITAADVVGPTGQGIEPGSFDEILRAMRAGHSYANIHTTRWPAGEIRGQINNEDQKQFDK
jgi:hypothetical protein